MNEKRGRDDVPAAAPAEPQAGAARAPSKESSSYSSDAAGAEGEVAQSQPSESARDHSKKSLSPPSSPSSLSDELAATGMGRRTRFDVTRVDLDLEDSPAASVRLRYEFRAQLVALGVLPREIRDPIARREAGRGFDDYCPQPN